jgi:rRNA maturation endonuclease Nob1
MEGIITKQVRFGRSCQKCKAYFVTDKKDARVCPWCERIELGHLQSELYEYPEQTTEAKADS